MDKQNLLEIYEHIPFFEELLERGSRIIQQIRDSGTIDAQVKDTFPTGGIDFATKADTEAAQLYYGTLRQTFPKWSCVIEDLEEAKKVNSPVIFFVDPLDGTNLFKEGKFGYSTMLSAAVQQEDGYYPVLGMINIIGGELLWGYNDGERIVSNISKGSPKESRALEELVLGRTTVDRSGLLTPACNSLGSKIQFLRGVGPQTLALVTGQTDLFVYDPPGLSFWDAYPAMPIIQAHGGEIFNWLGETPLYNGTSLKCNGFVAIAPHVSKDEVLVRIQRSKTQP